MEKIFVGLVNIPKLMADQRISRNTLNYNQKKAVNFHFSNLVVTVDPFRETTGKWSLNGNWKQFCVRLISVCFYKTIFMDKLDPFLTLPPSVGLLLDLPSYFLTQSI